MAFFKPIYKKMSKKWHPQAVSVGKPIEMDELCKQIALISTVSSADSKATLEALSLVLGSSMNTGRTVHVEGLGTFYYTCVSNGKGVDSAEKVNANQISGTRVRFIPESRRQGSAVTRTLIGENVTWNNVSSISGLDGTGSGKPSGGDGGLEEDHAPHLYSKKTPRCTLMMQWGALHLRETVFGVIISVIYLQRKCYVSPTFAVQKRNI